MEKTSKKPIKRSLAVHHQILRKEFYSLSLQEPLLQCLLLLEHLLPLLLPCLLLLLELLHPLLLLWQHTRPPNTVPLPGPTTIRAPSSARPLSPPLWHPSPSHSPPLNIAHLPGLTTTQEPSTAHLQDLLPPLWCPLVSQEPTLPLNIADATTNTTTAGSSYARETPQP